MGSSSHIFAHSREPHVCSFVTANIDDLYRKLWPAARRELPRPYRDRTRSRRHGNRSRCGALLGLEGVHVGLDRLVMLCFFSCMDVWRAVDHGVDFNASPGCNLEIKQSAGFLRLGIQRDTFMYVSSFQHTSPGVRRSILDALLSEFHRFPNPGPISPIVVLCMKRRIRGWNWNLSRRRS